MNAIEVRPLAATVGAEVLHVSGAQLANDAAFAHELLDLLERHGVLVLPEVNLLPEQQVQWCRNIGAVDLANGNHPVDGIYRVSLDPAITGRSATYLRGTFVWHVDGCTPDGDECPQRATVLSAKAVAERGGATEFANTYAAFEDLTDAERERCAQLRVVHSLEASQRRAWPDPSPKQVAIWKMRPVAEHPLVWTHRDGRRSLLLGASADHVVGMDRDESRALLDDLLARATRPGRVYRHEWSVGDTVIWDNRGVLHRAEPYDPASGREMLRTTILGDEPIQ